jgi:hypothetical protein
MIASPNNTPRVGRRIGSVPLCHEGGAARRGRKARPRFLWGKKSAGTPGRLEIFGTTALVGKNGLLAWLAGVLCSRP